MCDRLQAGKPSWYVASDTGQLSLAIIIIIIINEYPEAGLTAFISVHHIYYKHEFQQKNY